MNNSKTNWRKLRGMTFLGTLGFIMLFHYQNCAPAGGARSFASSTNDGGSLVTTIDNVNTTTGVSFPQSKISVPSSDDANVVRGDCSGAQNGATIGYKVVDSEGQTVVMGQSLCSGSHFDVTVLPGNNLQCGESYLIEAQLASGSIGLLPLSRDCSELASN